MAVEPMKGVSAADADAANQAAQDRATEYWRRNIRLISILLTIWFTVSYVFGILLAGVLQNISIGSLPLGFWFGQQGSIMTFMVLILVYAVLMDRMDKEFDVDE